MREQRILAHDARWLYSRDLLEKGGIPLDIYDQMTSKRIDRIIKLQEQRMEERKKAMEEQRDKQDRETKNRQQREVRSSKRRRK